MKSRSPGGKGLHLPPPSSDEESNSDDNDKKADGSSSKSDEESSESESSTTVEPKYYCTSFNRLINDDYREKRYSPVIDVYSSEF